jgi:UDP-N-acetylglucosamine 2-epimerase (non-hydrolysing)
MSASVMLLVGTRADAIKMAPLIREVSRHKDLKPLVVATSQHREMLDQVLEAFNLKVDIDLNIMRPGQTLTDVTIRALEGLEKILSEHKIDITIVQGDTSTSFIGGLISFYHQIPVAHVEAGLRTYDLMRPFPEEANRRQLDAISTLLFPPTQTAKKQLLAENLPENAMFVTGNTAIDSLLWVTGIDRPISDPKLQEIAQNKSRKLIVVTAHRRESFGEPFQRLIQALSRISREHPETDLVYPVHLNPNVDGPVRNALSNTPGVHLVKPLDYFDFAKLMQASELVLTDSGGIQEEAPVLGKPVVVMREVTERPEGVEAGVSVLVGTDEDLIVRTVGNLLTDPVEYSKMAKRALLYGDGHASERIITAVRRHLGLTEEYPQEFTPKIEEIL